MNIDDIQREYLPVSKKKLRAFVKMYLPIKIIGGRICVERVLLERLLSDVERDAFPLK